MGSRALLLGGKAMMVIKEVVIILAVIGAKFAAAEDDVSQAVPGYVAQKPVSSTTFPPDLIDRFPELTTLNRRPAPTKAPPTSTARYVRPQTVLEYKPITPFYHPRPVTLAQIIPPGKPWPASAEKPSNTLPDEMAPQTVAPSKNYTESFIKTSTTETPEIDQRLPELMTLVSFNKPTTEILPAQTILEYKPIISFHHPNPVTLAQIIPPGKPWPASANEYTSKAPSTSSEASTPNLVDRLPNTSLAQTPIPFKNQTESSLKPPTTKAPQLDERFPELTTSKPDAATILEYKPIISFYHPNPVTLAQIIPPGKPWPASADEYTSKAPLTSSEASTSNLVDRLPDLTTTKLESQTVLEYKPITPSFHPKPVTVAQIVPPGKPWPASSEKSPQPSLEERFPETTIALSESTTNSNHIILTYQPQRPWYHQQPGNTIGQIVPPGKPWPASAADYGAFSATSRPPWLKEADGNELENFNNLQSITEEPSPVPNALQYYGPSITWSTTDATPFTSSVQETTISDIMDILQEARDKTVGEYALRPSDLLPFDVDVGRSGDNRASDASASIYDGTALIPNPKFLQGK